MTGGTLSATAHGPSGELAKNQTPFSTAYQVVPSTRRTGSEALTTYWRGVPSIGASFGSPSYSGGVIAVAFLSTFAV